MLEFERDHGVSSVSQILGWINKVLFTNARTLLPFLCQLISYFRAQMLIQIVRLAGRVEY